MTSVAGMVLMKSKYLAAMINSAYQTIMNMRYQRVKALDDMAVQKYTRRMFGRDRTRQEAIDHSKSDYFFCNDYFWAEKWQQNFLDVLDDLLVCTETVDEVFVCSKTLAKITKYSNVHYGESDDEDRNLFECL